MFCFVCLFFKFWSCYVSGYILWMPSDSNTLIGLVGSKDWSCGIRISFGVGRLRFKSILLNLLLKYIFKMIFYFTCSNRQVGRDVYIISTLMTLYLYLSFHTQRTFKSICAVLLTIKPFNEIFWLILIWQNLQFFFLQVFMLISVFCFCLVLHLVLVFDTVLNCIVN